MPNPDGTWDCLRTVAKKPTVNRKRDSKIAAYAEACVAKKTFSEVVTYSEKQKLLKKKVMALLDEFTRVQEEEIF